MTTTSAHEAVADFYREHHERLWRSLLAYTGDPELASDAEAEALAQALRRGEALHDPAAWIWRSAYRIAAGLLADLDGPTTEPGEPTDHGVLTEPLLDTLSLLDKLPPQQRAIVGLRYLADLKPAVIAVILNTTSGTVRVQLHRAHTALRSQWNIQRSDR